MKAGRFRKEPAADATPPQTPQGSEKRAASGSADGGRARGSAAARVAASSPADDSTVGNIRPVRLLENSKE